MNIVKIQDLEIPEVKVIHLARFADVRGIFTGLFRLGTVQSLPFLRGFEIGEVLESRSYRGVVRGLHLQWNPEMGKLVRIVAGHLFDLILDVRKGSPTFGKMLAYSLPAKTAGPEQWIWIPPGFAHGTFFPEESVIQYLCGAEHNPACEASISPFADDLDWSLNAPELCRDAFLTMAGKEPILSEKDKKGLTLAQWMADPRSDNFVMGRFAGKND